MPLTEQQERDYTALHVQAMELSERADALRKAGDNPSALSLLEQAFQLEKSVALAADRYPGRSILLKSAAVLALESLNVVEAHALCGQILADERTPGFVRVEALELFQDVQQAQASKAIGDLNVAAELLEKLLKEELKVRSRHNLVQSQLFSEKLKKTLNGYHNRAISTLEVIEELIRLAKEMDAASKRGNELGLTDDEIAFYDALAANESAVQAMGDANLKVIAAELVTQVRKSVTIDWTLRESARGKIRVMVKRILNQYGYPPDLQDEAVKTVLMQAEILCAEWSS